MVVAITVARVSALSDREGSDAGICFRITSRAPSLNRRATKTVLELTSFLRVMGKSLGRHDGNRIKGEAAGGEPAARGMGRFLEGSIWVKLLRPVRVSGETQEENDGTYRDASSYYHRRSLQVPHSSNHATILQFTPVPVYGTTVTFASVLWYRLRNR
jgi:hypothetical protein